MPPPRTANFRLNSGGAHPAWLTTMLRPYDDIERLTALIIRSAIEVHRILGPGLLEDVYRQCLIAELRSRGLFVESERDVPVIYKGQEVKAPLRLDILVDRKVVVEVKASDGLLPVHQSQVITYLKLTGSPAGLLMNFNEVLLKNGLKRLDHPDRYVSKREDPNGAPRPPFFHSPVKKT